MKFIQRVAFTIQQAKHSFLNKATSLLVINLALIFFQVIYLSLRYAFINTQVPFWFTKNWGDYQLVAKSMLFYFPLMSLCIVLVGILLLMLNRYFIRYFTDVLFGFVFFCNAMLTFSLMRIIYVASKPFEPLINPLYVTILFPFAVAFLVVYFLLPFFIDFAHKQKIVTNPQLHQHPGMVLLKPSARGGGFFYALVFIALSLIFVGLNTRFNGLFFSVLMLGVIGILDDIQNTHATSVFRFLENPRLRLLLLCLAVLPVIGSGITINFLNIPFGGLLDLSSHSFFIAGDSVRLLSGVITVLWIVWLMNVLSWSNGIDGQFCGIVGVASLVISLLALRFHPLEQYHMQIALMGAISAGASFGFTKYTWNPSKIMWGFGAMSAGLVLSGLSISERSKIVASILVILIPFLDALVTAVRRMLQHKSPLQGDRGHLHHLLLAKGWSPKRIALFYWLSTGVLGIIGLISSDQYVWQVTLILTGLIAFVIILLNFESIRSKQPKQ